MNELIHQFSAGDRSPYTYLVYSFPTNQIYYGVKYAKGCMPSDLGKTYFSSSRKLHRLIKEHGREAFRFEVRLIFKSIEQAKRCETKVLQKFDVRNNNKFLNKHNNDGFYPVDNRGTKNPMYGTISPMRGKQGICSMKGKQHTSKSKNKISKSMIGKNIGHKHTIESKLYLSECQKGKKHHRFTGYYHTPHGVFESSREAELPKLSYKVIQKWCKNSNKIISNRAIVQSLYLETHHLGKSFKDIGFWFQSL